MTSDSPLKTIAKSAPVPTRFSLEEASFLDQAKRETGLSVSEIIRRSVRLARRQQQLVASHDFFLKLHSAA